MGPRSSVRSITGDQRDVPEIRQAARRHDEDLTVVAGALGDRAELMGALALVVGQSEQVLSGRVVAATGR